MKRNGKCLEILIQNVLTRLEELKWNRKTFAESLGMTPSRITLYLSGKATPSLEIIEAMAEALGLTVPDLLRESGGEPKAAAQVSDQLVMTLSKTIDDLAQQVQELENQNMRLRALGEGKLAPELARLVSSYLNAPEDARRLLMEALEGDEGKAKMLSRLLSAYQSANPYVRLAAIGFLSGDQSVADELDRLMLEDKARFQLSKTQLAQPPHTPNQANHDKK